MNTFDSWLKSMADSSKTCDTVITESTKKIKRHRLGKLSEDEQGIIKYRRLLDKWINKDQDDDYVETDDDGNEISREPGEINYSLKPFYSLIISNQDYEITFDGDALSPEKLRNDGEGYLYNIFTSDDVWYKNIECKLDRGSYSIGMIIYQLLREDKTEETESGIMKAGQFLQELFETMIEYDVGKIEKFFKKYNIEIVNEKLGTIKVSYESLDTLFDITMTPMED